MRKVLRALLIFCCIAASLLATLWGLSHFRMVRRESITVTWRDLTPNSPLQTARVAALVINAGRFEASVTDDFLMSASREPDAEPVGSTRVRWVWERAVPFRQRSWDDRWHATRWNEWRAGDLGWYTTTGGGATSRVFALPLWIPAVLAAIPGCVWAALVFRGRYRVRTGRCHACGHDRAGLPVAAVCPECGQAAAGGTNSGDPTAEHAANTPAP